MELIDEFELNDPKCNFRVNKSEVILSSFAINLLSLGLPVMALQVYDRIMLNPDAGGTLIVLSSSVILAIIVEGILRIARSYITGWAGMVYEYSMSANAMKRYINSDPAKLKHEGAGGQIQSLGAFSKLRDFYSGQTLVTLVDIPFALLFIMLIYYMTGKLVIVPIVLITIFTYITWIIGNNLKQALEDQGGVDNKRYNFIIETLLGIHTVKSFGVEAIFQRRYESLEEDSSITNYNTAIISNQGYTFGVLFNELMSICITAVGALMVIDGQFTTGALIATVLLSNRLMQPIQKTLFLWTQFQDYRLAYNKALEIFSIEQMDRGIVESLSTTNVEGEIKVTNLSFSYGNKVVFEEVNLALKVPEVIAIHGPTNAGKSTLMRLIAGISKPTSGSVMIDGTPSINFTSEELVKHVGYISSENIIFQGTVLENLTAFDATKTEQAMEIAKLLKIDKEIALMPNGYDTKLYDGVADAIAPGVKQRIAIARTLINKPKIILFNNADKGLDREGYKHLIKLMTLLKGKVAMIICSEDHNINRLADKEYILDKKMLREITLNDSNIHDVKPYKEFKL